MKLIRSRLPAVVALVLCAALVMSNAACGPSRDQLVKVAGYGQQLAALIEANATLPDQLAAEHAIDEATRAKLAEAIATASDLAGRFNVSMKAALAAPGDKAAEGLPLLVPLVADMIGQVRTIRSLVPKQSAQRVLGGIEVALRAVANYFALQRAEAHRRGFTDEQLARMARARYDPRAVETVAAYANAQAPAYERSS